MVNGLGLPQLCLEKPSKPRRTRRVSPPWWGLPRNETALLGICCPRLSVHTHRGQHPEFEWQRSGQPGLQKMPTGSIVMPGNRVHQRWHRFDLLCYASLKCSSVLRLCGPPCPRLPLGFAASPGKTSPGSPRKMRRKWLGTKDLRRGDGDAKYKTFLAEKAPGFLLVNHHRGKRAGSAAVAGEGGGGAHQVVFWSCECRALGPDFSEKCNKRKPSYFPEIFVTIQVQRCFSAEISVTGFFAATSKLNPSRHLLGLSRTSVPGQSRGSGMPEKAFLPITSSPPLSRPSL